MTNNQCYSYSVKALSNIFKSDFALTPSSFHHELYNVLNIYSEDEIERLVRRLEADYELF